MSPSPFLLTLPHLHCSYSCSAILLFLFSFWPKVDPFIVLLCNREFHVADVDCRNIQIDLYIYSVHFLSYSLETNDCCINMVVICPFKSFKLECIIVFYSLNFFTQIHTSMVIFLHSIQFLSILTHNHSSFYLLPCYVRNFHLSRYLQVRQPLSTLIPATAR